MRPTSRSPRRRILASLARTATVALTGLATLAAGPGARVAGRRRQPGDARAASPGYGFDQCTAPTQRSMDAWLTSSPYWAVGIYISGDSRGCLSQPNLSPTWVSTQLAKGWRLLPITLGPQASCTTRERYLRPGADQPVVDRHLRRRPQPGPRRGRQDGRGRPGARHLRRQHAVVRPRGLRHLQDRLPRVGADVPVRPGPSSCTPAATSPASTPAPPPASRCSTTPAPRAPAPT